MKLLTSAVLIAAIGFSPYALAEPSEKDAISMVENGAAFMKASGKDEMIKRINAKDADYVQGALYLTMRDNKGVILPDYALYHLLLPRLRRPAAGTGALPPCLLRSRLRRRSLRLNAKFVASGRG